MDGFIVFKTRLDMLTRFVPEIGMNDLTRAQQDKLSRIFHQFDIDGNGSIALKEFRVACRRFSPNISYSEIDHLAQEVHSVLSLHKEFQNAREIKHVKCT